MLAAVSIRIRFNSTLPDLDFLIPSPATTGCATISQLIRPHLPPDQAQCPLRYIYAGTLLHPDRNLATLLRLGLAPNCPSALEAGPAAAPSLPPYYIHCSISSNVSLTLAQQQAEILAAESEATPSPGPSIPDANSSHGRETQPRQQGFDRLLLTGFTQVEIDALRAQFLAIQAHNHTPDRVPRGAVLYALEDRWLDDVGVGPSTGSGAMPEMAAGNASPGFGEETSGSLDDMLWGNILGFFWPGGVLVWLLREDGVWSPRKQLAVLTGVFVNLAFCVLSWHS